MEKGYGLGEPPEEYKGPSWSTIRSNYWKEQVKKPGAEKEWTKENLDRMKEGKSPIINSQKIILHHPFGRKGKNIENYYPMRQDEHIAFHREHGYRYDEERGWH